MRPIEQYIQSLAAVRELSAQGRGRSREARAALAQAHGVLGGHLATILAYLEGNAARKRADLPAARQIQFAHEARIALSWAQRRPEIERRMIRALSRANGRLNRGEHPKIGVGYDGLNRRRRLRPTPSDTASPETGRIV